MANRLKSAVKGLLQQAYAPDQTKNMRLINASEAAELLEASMPYMRKCHSDGTLPEPEHATKSQRRFTATELWEGRQLSRSPTKRLPWRREGEVLQVWQLMNFKGGCSKTTATVHVAHYLALHGFHVLLIDMAPQGSLTGMCGLDPHTEFGGTTIYNAITTMEDSKAPMRDVMGDVVKETFMPGLSIAPADLMLSEFKMEARRDPLFATQLLGAIGQVQDDFDVVLIDSPPELDILTLTGMSAATSLLVPMTPSMMNLGSGLITRR